MKTAQDLLTELNTLDEHLTIEAKTASEVGTSLMETVCAFANEPQLGGGYILLGVAPASDSFWPVFEVVGVANPDKLQQDVASQCACVFNVPIRPKIVVERLATRPSSRCLFLRRGLTTNRFISRISHCRRVLDVESVQQISDARKTI